MVLWFVITAMCHSISLFCIIEVKTMANNQVHVRLVAQSPDEEDKVSASIKYTLASWDILVLPRH